LLMISGAPAAVAQLIFDLSETINDTLIGRYDLFIHSRSAIRDSDEAKMLS
jgi:hypothetical protein